MSDKQTAVGVCTEISEKSGWTSFHIDVGSKYPLRLATKLAPLIEQARAAGQGTATWTYTERESDNINENTGKPYTNRYLEGVDANGAADPDVRQQAEQSLATAPATAATAKPLLGGDKDRAITRMACLKAAAETMAPTFTPAMVGVEGQDPALEVMRAAARFENWVYRGIEDTPF